MKALTATKLALTVFTLAFSGQALAITETGGAFGAPSGFDSSFADAAGNSGLDIQFGFDGAEPSAGTTSAEEDLYKFVEKKNDEAVEQKAATPEAEKPQAATAPAATPEEQPK